MNIIVQYEQAVLEGKIQDDLEQRRILPVFNQLADALASNPRFWFRRGRLATPEGIYLHGSVGSGKTFLMDLFYQSVDNTYKSRVHFHQFMQQIDAQLRHLQGTTNPLMRIARELSRTTRLLCLDEFLVHDIADAMILGELLRALFTHDVVLVATSNTEPDGLYLNGLQRARFLPAIEQIKAHCQILCLEQAHDYRRGRTASLQAYFYPSTSANLAVFSAQFSALAVQEVPYTELVLQNRPVACVKCGQQAVWFEFDVICNVPRSQLDYLEIAQRFKTVFVSGVHALGAGQTGRALLLMHLVDVLYDARCRLILAADVPLEAIYPHGRVHQAFQRTLSRLAEMQSVEYLQP